MSDAKRAEQLWITAHEHVKQGNLAQAVRDLASCYEMLKALRDPRLAQVHRRWVEVHKLYQERKARAKAAASQSQAIPVQGQPQGQAPASHSQAVPVQGPGQAVARGPGAPAAQSSPFGQMPTTQVPPAQPAATRPASASTPDLPQVGTNEPVRAEPRFSQAEARTLGEEAEAAANAGKLDEAIALYERLVADSPSNELARERLVELRAARARKSEMSGPEARAPHVAASLPPSSVVANVAPASAAPGKPGVSPRSFPPGPEGDVAFLEALLQQVQERARAR